MTDTNDCTVDPYSTLIPIMEKYGATCTREVFQEAVNITFHKFESAVYDDNHLEMWDTLPAHFDYLSRALIGALPPRKRLRVLDVGCGTGLSSELLLETELGKRICHIDLLDTSEAMLTKALNRAQNWGVPHGAIHGTIDAVPPSSRYDLIAACSVLHHIPDLTHAFRKIRNLQGTGGGFMHLQDPNGDMMDDPELDDRRRRLRSLRRGKWTPTRLVEALCRRLRPESLERYHEQVNRELLAREVIKSDMSASDMWAVTDIHVGKGRGVSLKAIGEALDEYALAARRSYSFFGEMSSTLPMELQAEESQLLAKGAASGFHISAVWVHNGSRNETALTEAGSRAGAGVEKRVW